MGAKAEAIRAATYGKDVRENIAQGVEVAEQLREDYNAQVINAGNSNAEVVDARGTKAKLKDRLDGVDTTLAANTKQLAIDITQYGAVGDGTTDCISAFNSAISSLNVTQVLKFPQNTTKNAVYYFSENPTLDNLKIDCDDGVILSFPTSNAISFKTAKFLNNISIISRDRNNTGLQLKNDYSDLLSNSFTDNDVSVGVKKLSLVSDTNIQKNIYTAGVAAVANATLTNDSNTNMYYMANVGDIAHSTSKIVTTEFDFSVGNLYSCDFQFAASETNTNFVFGITTSDGTNANWTLYGIKADGTAFHFGNTASSFANLDVRDWSALLNDAYKAVKGVIFSLRPVGNNKIEIYLNGFYMHTVTIPFTFTKIGFGMLTINQTGQGLQNTQWGRIVTGKCAKSNRGNVLKIATFGDSITFGEGATISWADYLPNLLNGQKGINKAFVTNYAHSGNRSTEQLSTMQSADLSSFDIVCILIGTNDIQTGVSLDTFKSNVQTMINLAKTSHRQVILGIPPMWISETLTGVGAITGEYQSGASYRSILMQLAATNDIYIADTLSEIGRIGVDNVLYILRDNLHPNAFGQILLSRCFARSILSAITQDI